MTGRCNLIHELALFLHLLVLIGLPAFLFELFEGFALFHGGDQLVSLLVGELLDDLYALFLVFDVRGQMLDVREV